MTKPVDLDALDAAHARLGTLSPDYWQEEDGDYIAAVVRTVSEHEAPDVVPDDDADGSSDPWYWARSEASTTATNAVEILNAYPLMSAELRERRAREEAMAADLARISEELGLPPGIGPAPGELRRMLAERPVVDEVQTLAVDDVEFLDRHEAVIQFRNGHVYIELTRADGLRCQYNAATICELVNRARASFDRKVHRG